MKNSVHNAPRLVLLLAFFCAAPRRPLHANDHPLNRENNIPSRGTETYPDNCSRDPVDLLIGNRWFRQGDFLLPTPGLPLEFSRQYNSGETDYEGPLGKGWFHSLDWRLSEVVEVVHEIRIELDSGGGFEFYSGDPPGNQPQGGMAIKLPQISYGTATIRLIDDHEIIHAFEIIGHPYFQVNHGAIKLVTAYVWGAWTRPPPKAYFGLGNHSYYHDFGPEILGLETPHWIGHQPDSVIEEITVLPDYCAWSAVSRTNHWMEVYSGDGRRTRLHPLGANFVSQDSPWHVYPEGTNYVLVVPGGVERIFSPDGLLRQMRDFRGNTIALFYQGDKLTQASHSSGTSIDFTYAEERLVGVAVSDDLHLALSYTDDAQLARVVRHVSGHSTTSRYEYVDGVLTRNINAIGQTAEYFYESPYGTLAYRSTGMHFQQDWIPEQIVYNGNDARRVTYPARGQEPLFEYGFSPKTRLIERKHGPGTDLADARRRGISFHYQGASSATRLPWLAEERHFDLDLDECFSIFTERDSRRLPTSVAVAYGSDANPVPVLGLQWDAQTLQPTEITDPAGGRTRIVYENRVPVRIHEYYSDTQSHTTHLTHTNGLLAAIEDARGQVTAFGYDPAGYLSSVTPPAGPSLRLTHSANGFPAEAEILPEGSTNGTGRIYRFSRNARGRLDAMTYPDGRSTVLEYDALDRLTRLVVGGRRADIAYTPLGRVASVTRFLDPLGPMAAPSSTPVRVSIAYDKWLNALDITEPRGRYVETYQLDLQDRPVEVTNIEGQTMTLSYGLGGIVHSVTRFDGSTIAKTYDNAGRPAAVKFSSGDHEKTLSFAYTANGQPSGIADETGQVGLSYDRLGQVINETQAGIGLMPAALASTYDPVGSRTNLSVTINGSVALGRRYQTDAAGRLIQLHAPEAQAWLLAFNPTNGLTAAVAPESGGPAAQFTYDLADRLTAAAWSGTMPAMGFAMAYDAADRITNLVHAGGETRGYAYDSLDRLIGESHYNASSTLTYSAAYAYDLAGNRTQTVINGVTNTYTLGPGNRLSTCSSGAPPPETPLAYAYDAAGNVTSITDASGSCSLAWDLQYRLVQVSVDGVPAETYGYDPLGRRAWTASGSVTNWHLFDGIHCIADTDGQGRLLRSYTWGPGIDNLLAVTVHGAATNTYHAITDPLGTVHALTDATGAIAESYRYDAWGNVLGVYDGGGLPVGDPQTTLGNRYLFQGREYSWATGLYHFRARWYDPVTGRWLSKDPIGISGGVNQYVFCGNNPVNARDPFGLEWELFPTGPDVPNGAILIYRFDPAPVNAAIANGVVTVASGVGNLAGKVWNSPNTALGLALGLSGVPFGADVSFGHNAIQFENHPFMLPDTGLTLGNAILYEDEACENYGFRYSIGEHEERHTYQGQLLGPFYLPVYLIGAGATGLQGNHPLGPSHFMELGPYSAPPRTWPWSK